MVALSQSSKQAKGERECYANRDRGVDQRWVYDFGGGC